MAKLLGDDWDLQTFDHVSTGSSGSQKGAITKTAIEMCTALVRQPYNAKACTPVQIPAPGFVEVHVENEKEEEAKQAQEELAQKQEARNQRFGEDVD